MYIVNQEHDKVYDYAMLKKKTHCVSLIIYFIIRMNCTRIIYLNITLKRLNYFILLSFRN